MSTESTRPNALGAPDALLAPHPLDLILGADGDARPSADRELFRGALDEKPPSDLRLALNQDQPIGNDRFNREIEVLTGQRRELRQRSRPGFFRWNLLVGLDSQALNRP